MFIQNELIASLERLLGLGGPGARDPDSGYNRSPEPSSRVRRVRTSATTCHSRARARCTSDSSGPAMLRGFLLGRNDAGYTNSLGSTTRSGCLRPSRRTPQRSAPAIGSLAARPFVLGSACVPMGCHIGDSGRCIWNDDAGSIPSSKLPERGVTAARYAALSATIRQWQPDVQQPAQPGSSLAWMIF